MNLQFASNIPSMGNDRIDRDTEMIGDFLVRHALNQ